MSATTPLVFRPSLAQRALAADARLLIGTEQMAPFLEIGRNGSGIGKNWHETDGPNG